MVNNYSMKSFKYVIILKLFFSSYSSGIEAVEMQEISSDKNNNEKGEPSNEDRQSTTKPTGCSRYKKRLNRRALKERLTSCKERAQKSRVVRLLMTFAKVMFKFCTTSYDIASDFLQGKQSFLGNAFLR